jgi:hypothetical protein
VFMGYHIYLLDITMFFRRYYKTSLLSNVIDYVHQSTSIPFTL